MADQTRPLRIFVAMPGDLGAKSPYKTDEGVKQNLYYKIRDRLATDLKRPVNLVVEKDKLDTVPIHDSMFAEAFNAEIYIADLTNANPNVYLELGVRWAVSDGLTILVYQNQEDLKFNVSGNRGFLYTPDNISHRIDQIAKMITDFLDLQKDRDHANWSDSPVRKSMDVILMKRTDVEHQLAEIQRLQEARGEELFKAAMAAPTAEHRIPLLRRVVAINPAYVDALFELGIAYRLISDYGQSEQSFVAARRLDPSNSLVHRELGVTYSKLSHIDDAINSFREALSLNPSDRETWKNLGGALRRRGVSNAPQEFDVSALQEARDCYDHVAKEDEFDLYAALNVCRLDILLAQWNPNKYQVAVEGFKDNLPLCQRQVRRHPKDRWLYGDLAETYLFSGDVDSAKSTFQAALTLVPAAEHADYLRSVLAPLKGYLLSKAVPDLVKSQVQEIMATLPSFD